MNLDCEYDSIVEKLIEEVDRAIPDDLKQKLQSTEFRKELLAKHGKSAFLDSNRLKFPVYDMDGPNCHLLYAAYLRSASRSNTGSALKDADYYAKIKTKANRLFNKHGCSEKLQVKLQEDDVIDYIDLTQIFEYNKDGVDLSFIYAE